MLIFYQPGRWFESHDNTHVWVRIEQTDFVYYFPRMIDRSVELLALNESNIRTNIYAMQTGFSAPTGSYWIEETGGALRHG